MGGASAAGDTRPVQGRAGAASSNAAPEPLLPPEPARGANLDWVASFEGLEPRVFGAGDEFLLASIGRARLGGKPVQTETAPSHTSKFFARDLLLARVGADGAVRSVVAAALAFSWVKALGRLASGDVIAHGVRAGAEAHELYRFRSDGSLVWARELAGETMLRLFALDEKSGKMALSLVPGHEEADQKFGSSRRGPKTKTDNPVARVLFLDGTGAERWSGAIDALCLRALAVHEADGVVLGGVVATTLPKVSFLPPSSLRSSSAWVALLGDAGAVHWVHIVGEDQSRNLSRLRWRSDGTIAATGSDVKRRAGFMEVLDAKTGVSKHTHAPEANEKLRFIEEKGDIWVEEVSSSDVIELSSRSRAGDERWRAEIGPAVSVMDAATLADGTCLIVGRHPGLLLLPGLEPPAAFASAESFAWFLALVSEVPLGTKATPPRVLDRASPAQAPAGGIAALKKRALTAFRAKRYRDACPLFAEIVNLLPRDAAGMGDFGFCLQQMGETGLAILVDRYAVRLAARDTSEDLAVRRAVYHNLATLETKKPLSFYPKPCMTLASDAFGCEKPVFVCGVDGTYGMDTRVAIITYTAARFALSAEAAALEPDLYALSWPELGDGPTETSDRSGASSFDISLKVDRDSRDGNYNTVTNEVSTCDVVYADGCSGRVGLSCSWQDMRSNDKPVVKVIELALDPP
jgi:hypothetical protein